MTDTTSTDATEDTRPLLERARSGMRGLAEVETALSEVAVRLRQARGAVRPEEAVVDVALTAVVAGETVPDDLGDRVLEIRHSNEAQLAEAQVLGPLERRLRERLLAVHREQADAALAVLRAELGALLSQARPVLAELGSNVDSADAAISADRVQQWRHAVALAARYDEVRQAQRVLVSAVVSPESHVSDRVSREARAAVDDYGTVVDADRHYPEVGTDVNRSEVRIGETRIFSGRLVTSAHTDRPLRPRPWFTGDALTDLRFVCRADVEAWLPTVRQLTGARDEHEQRRQDDARAEAERLPGDEPDRRLPRGRQMPPPPAALVQRLAEEELGTR